MIPVGVCAFSFQNLRRPEVARSLGLPCPGTFDGLIDFAVHYGLSGAEAPLPPDTTPDESARLRERTEAASVRVVLAGGQAATSPLESLIPLAAALGARTLRLTISSILEGDRRAVGRVGWDVRHFSMRIVHPRTVPRELLARYPLVDLVVEELRFVGRKVIPKVEGLEW